MVARKTIWGPFGLPSAMSSGRMEQFGLELTAERLRIEDSRRSRVTLMNTPLFQKIALKDSGVSHKFRKLHTNSS